MIRRIYPYGIGLVLGAFVLLVGLAVSWDRPALPRTSLSGMELSTYYYTLRNLTEPSTEPVGLSFSLRECSRLAERFPPPFERYGFRLRGLYLEPRASSARILAVFQGPLSMYYRVDYTGQVWFEKGQWTITVERLWVGWLRLDWVLPGTWNPDWPRQWAGGRIKLERARLSAEGLSASVWTPPEGLSLSLNDFVS